jgi:TolB protein
MRDFMTNRGWLGVACLLVAGVAGSGTAADDDLRIVVTGTAAAKDAIALTGLQASGPQGRAFLQTLAADLERSGWYKVQAAGAAKVTGTVADAGSGVSAACTFSAAGRAFAWKHAGGDSRQEAHLLADEIVRRLKGCAGIAATRILMVRRTGSNRADLYLCDSDGRNLKQVTHDNVACVGPRWTPDGRHAYYTSYVSGRPCVYRIAVDGGPRELLAGYLGLNTGAAVSPDGRDVALILSFPGNPEVFLMHLGNGMERLTRTRLANEASPAWSPDGRQLAYVSDATGKPHVYIMDVASRQSRRATFRGTENVAPSWGPDGRIAYCSRREGSYQIALLDPRAGESAGTVSSGPDHQDPSWAPDGRHIVCSRREGSGGTVCILDTLGDPPVRSFALSGDWIAPEWSER